MFYFQKMKSVLKCLSLSLTSFPPSHPCPSPLLPLPSQAEGYQLPCQEQTTVINFAVHLKWQTSSFLGCLSNPCGWCLAWGELEQQHLWAISGQCPGPCTVAKPPHRAQPHRAGHEALPLDTLQPGDEVVFKISIYCCHHQQNPTTFSMF